MTITIPFMNGRAPLKVEAREMRDILKVYGKNFETEMVRNDHDLRISMQRC